MLTSNIKFQFAGPGLFLIHNFFLLFSCKVALHGIN